MQRQPVLAQYGHQVLVDEVEPLLHIQPTRAAGLETLVGLEGVTGGQVQAVALDRDRHSDCHAELSKDDAQPFVSPPGLFAAV